jgi:lipoprotein-releasing system ATP-binding protein
MNNVVLQCEQLGKSFMQGGHELTVLHDLDLEVKAGEKLAIIGVSGSGKTTLLNLMGGIDTPTRGRVLINGSDIAGLGNREQDTLRNRNLGFVYQFHHLLGEFTALENVAMPLVIARRPWPECEQRARQLMERVGLGKRLTHRPSQLSGGERQRVAIARALVNNPLCVLMDEPTGNLDRHSAQSIHQLVRELNEQLQTSFILVTHDTSLAASMDRVLVLRDGRLLPAAQDQP